MGCSKHGLSENLRYRFGPHSKDYAILLECMWGPRIPGNLTYWDKGYSGASSALLPLKKFSIGMGNFDLEHGM